MANQTGQIIAALHEPMAFLSNCRTCFSGIRVVACAAFTVAKGSRNPRAFAQNHARSGAGSVSGTHSVQSMRWMAPKFERAKFFQKTFAKKVNIFRVILVRTGINKYMRRASKYQHIDEEPTHRIESCLLR